MSNSAKDIRATEIVILGFCLFVVIIGVGLLVAIGFKIWLIVS